MGQLLSHVIKYLATFNLSYYDIIFLDDMLKAMASTKVKHHGVNCKVSILIEPAKSTLDGG